MMARIFVLLLLVLVPVADRVNACSCAPASSSCDEYKAAPAVFITLVTDIDPVVKGRPEMPYVHLVVEHAFKGITETKLKMRQGSSGGDCSFVFEKQERYLIYAWYDNETKQLHTNICTRSRPLKYAADDLDYLRGIGGPSRGTRLSGSVIRYDYQEIGRSSTPELMSGVKVMADGGNNRHFEAVTNSEGFYRMLNLPPGRYRVTAEIPSYLSLAYDKEVAVEVVKDGCASADFFTRTDGRISGVLFDNRGRVTPDIDVDLIPFELADRLGDRGIGRFKKTDAAGRFEFTELTPGRYLIGVNIRQEPEGDNPFRRIFYPGVSSVSQAKVIVLGTGEKLKGYDFRLPPPLPVQTISGVFVWPDGTPVTRGLITLKDEAGGSLDFAEPDSQGRFTLKAINGTKGSVYGSVMVRVESGLDVIEANPVRVISNSNVGPIKLIASRKAKGGVTIIR